MKARTFWITLAWVLVAAGLHAQTPIAGEPDLSQVRIRIGPLYVDPTLSLTNLGVDTNVFNEADDQGPKRDFTFTVTPAANLWLRMGPSWLSGRVNEDIVWYKKYSGERSGNTSYNIGWNVPLNRLIMNVDASWLNTRDRPTYEIDARSQRVETSYRGQAEVRALSKTFIGAQVSRRHVDFDHDAVFLGSNLHDELNRTVTTAAGTFRYALTPLTSLVFSAGREQDHFDFSPERNSRSLAISGGVQFDPDALLKGSATFGYRNFQPVDPTLPSFRGSTAQVSLTYVAGGATQVTVTATRNLEYLVRNRAAVFRADRRPVPARPADLRAGGGRGPLWSRAPRLPGPGGSRGVGANRSRAELRRRARVSHRIADALRRECRSTDADLVAREPPLRWASRGSGDHLWTVEPRPPGAP